MKVKDKSSGQISTGSIKKESPQKIIGSSLDFFRYNCITYFPELSNGNYSTTILFVNSQLYQSITIPPRNFSLFQIY